MKQVQRILSVTFWTGIIIGACIAVVFETMIVEPGVLSGISENTEFIVTTMMEMLTLLFIPVSLKLFKFGKVHADLITRKSQALALWGGLRMTVLLLLLLVNTLLYYMYMNTAFGYMAIICLLCLPFIYPSMNRCIAETEDEETEINQEKSTVE